MFARSLSALVLASAFAACVGVSRAEQATGPALRTIAIRVHNLDPMLRFYREAFGFDFRRVRTGAVESHFGQLGELTLKLVPLRGAADFVDFPSHQLGFEVSDVYAVRSLAERCGGRVEGAVSESNGRLQAAVRDPDGNTIELYSRP